MLQVPGSQCDIGLDGKIELAAKTTAYRGYLLAIALVPLPLLWGKVIQIQLTYAILGALFMPLLALTGLAELICHGDYRSLDLSRFGYGRILENTPIFEDNVV